MTRIEWQQCFSDKVNSLMKERGINQSQLAARSDVSKGRLSEYLNMRSMPTIFAIINIADVLEVGIGDIIDFGERID